MNRHVPLNINRPKNRNVRGISLVEILIVIAIITILFSIGLFGLQAMRGSTQIATTRAMLSTLKSIDVEYANQTGQRITLAGLNREYPDESGASTSAKSIKYFIDRVKDNTPDVYDIVTGNIKSQFLVYDEENSDNYGTIIAIHDFWDNPIRFYPGLIAWPRPGGDKEDYGLPLQDGSYFVSAGPDGIWGAYDSETNEPIADSGSEDNIYSFDLDG